jgi:hypothetical protein
MNATFSFSHSEGPSNRFNFDYVAKAADFQKFDFPIIDMHTHIHGIEATEIFLYAAQLYGVNSIHSMTQLEGISNVRSVAGSTVKFICMPSFSHHDRLFAHGEGYKEKINSFIEAGARVVKFWNAPRIYESSSEPFITNPFRLNSDTRYDVMRFCEQKGLIFMTHIGDPDTWFTTKYRDSHRYGTKRQQYDDLEEVLNCFKRPWIGAHMLGYPEDLNFLSQMLARYPYLYLDCSATKWIVRELSKHPKDLLREFFSRWRDRILFGSDIVTSDEHLVYKPDTSEMNAKASSRDEAFALYASRYWALRTLLETDFEGESPISDPDLHMTDPSRFSPHDAPMLKGFSLPREVLKKLYFENAKQLLEV